MSAESVYAASSTAYIAHQHLQHGGSANDLRAEAVLRPADRVDDGSHLLHVAVFADRGKQVGGLQELILWNTGDALHHLWRIA